jgi:KDO2-lipid IV(A) lauroyltransferase
MDRIVLDLREQYGSKCIAMSNTLRYIVNLAREDRKFVIGFIADQVPTWESISHWIDFFHQDTPVFTGTEKIAQRTASAVFYMSMKQTARGKYTATFHHMADDASMTAEHELTDMYFRMLEENIREQPHLWLWTHKRWKRTRKGYAERMEKRKRDRAEKMKNK